MLGLGILPLLNIIHLYIIFSGIVVFITFGILSLFNRIQFLKKYDGSKVIIFFITIIGILLVIPIIYSSILALPINAMPLFRYLLAILIPCFLGIILYHLIGNRIYKLLI